jgi:hypothetical protein
VAAGVKIFHQDIDLRGYLDLNGSEARNLRLQNLAADPGSPSGDGIIFYRTDTDKVRAYIAGAWKDLATMDDVTAAGISSTLVDAKGDLIVATAADTVARKAAGSNGTALFANSATGDGLEWRAILSSDLSDFAETVRDTIGTALVAGNNIDITVNDAGDTITIDVEGLTSADLSDFTTAARAAISVSDTATLDLTYSAGAISGAVLDSPTVGEFTGAAGIRTTAFTGEVTKTAGGTALTIADNAVVNARLADMAQGTIKGRTAGAGTGDPVDLTAAQVKTILAYAGTEVSFTPAQGIAATTVQAAIEEAVTDLTALINSTVTGQTWKAPVRVATTTNISLSGTQTIDGIAVVAGDRVLAKDQTTAADRGIYVVAAGAWSRAADADTAAENNNATVLIEEGTVNAGDIYTQTATIVTLGTTAQAWQKVAEGNAVYTSDGTTIELVGNSFRIATGAAGAGLTGGGGSALAVGAGTGITVNANDVAITAGGVTETQLAASVAGNGLTGGAGTALAVNVGAGLEISTDAVRIAAAAAGNGLTGGAGSALAVGAGTGISVAADAVSVDTAVVVRKATGTLTGGANSEVLTHNLNTRNVQLSVRNNASPYDEVEVANEATSVNTVTVYAGTGNNLPAGYTWVIVG